MKWKNRLQTILTQNSNPQNSKESLEMELRITAETPVSLVSAVIRSDDFRHYPKNNDELADFKAKKLREILNRFIENGVWFDVSAADFQIIDKTQTLKTSDREFLNLNGAAILCQLQQSLLMKHLFSHSPELLEDFAFEIWERESILIETAETNYDFYCAAVKDVTRGWFEQLLNKLTL